ncbi:MAG: DUF4332 domain-containing protein [Planctomycetaceae bacterium]
MYVQDLNLNRFGTLSDIHLNQLSQGITVFWGPNGCGKTTVVQFVRGLLSGFHDASAFSNSSVAEGGSLRFRSGSGLYDLNRTRHVAGAESFRVTELPAGQLAPRQDNHLPAWVNADVFREVFSVGYDEADRFDLLTRLCLDSGMGTMSLESEIRSTELALQQAISERDGYGAQAGIAQRIAELRRKQNGLQDELARLRRPAADLPERIQALIREIEGLTASIDRIDVRLRELDAEIDRLEKLLIELRRRNTLPLDREAIEARIRTLSSRLDRWRSIRESIARETNVAHFSSETDLRPHDSLLSVRALVARLEDRVQSLAGTSREGQWTESDWKREASAVRQLQAETATLCRYLSQHENAVAMHEESLEQLFAERSLTNASQMELLIQERIAALRAELNRSDDVLADAAIPVSPDPCRHSLHQDAWSSPHAYGTRLRSEDDVESELTRLRAERTRLVADRGQHEETRHTRRALLERLRSELAAAATLEQIDMLRSQIAEIDAQIELLEDRRRQLDHTERNLREVIERLKARCQPRVLELATVYIRRLTDGQCSQLLLSSSPGPQIMVAFTDRPEPLSISQLSRGTRHQVALALRLALIRVRSETNSHVPLILDDVFITSDDDRAEAVVELLTEFAKAGQQIVFFTCQKDVRDLFIRFHADVRTFGNRVVPPAPQPVLKAYVEEVRPVRMVVPEPVVVPPPAPEAVVVPSPPVASTPSVPGSTNWLFYLEVDHGIDDLAGVTLAELEALRAAGIHQIDDLLQRTVSQLNDTLQQAGYSVASERLQAFRGQAELTCRVPMLRRSDAALLFAAGIRSVDDLKSMRPETVYDRIVAFQRSEAGSRFRRAGRLIDRQQAINWARWGQHARSLSEARAQRSRFSHRSSTRIARTPDSQDDAQRLVRRDRIRQASSTSRRRPLLSTDRDVNQRRARRLARRRRLAAQSRSMRTGSESTQRGDQARETQRDAGRSSVRTTTDRTAVIERPVMLANVEGKDLRFFLSRSSDVEAAPSIGPRTAESLYALGVRTVDDLLTISAETLAMQMNHRRITGSVIELWQAQARLMCQVPELRGHDVQILVACGVLSPEDLSHRVPEELLSVVEPFANSREGERIIRNGRKPDLEEVSDWIRWAGSARAFRAA